MGDPLIKQTRKLTLAMGGILLGTILAEGAFRSVATPYISPAGQPVSLRQYGEGVTSPHLDGDGRRLTGNPEVPGAPSGLLLGDSYVLAMGVEDQDTMGAVLERNLRSRGKPVHVRQYGWAGVSTPHYIAHGPELLKRWNPRWVIVFLNREDLGQDPIIKNPTSDHRMIINSDGSWRLIHETRSRSTSVIAEVGRFGTHNSALLHLLQERLLLLRKTAHIDLPWQRVGEPRKEKMESLFPLVPRAVVQSLKQAFGDKLLIAYDGDSPGADHVPRPEREGQFLAACQAEHVHCTLLAATIRAGEQRLKRYAHGFHNGKPATGHFNERGHALVAEALDAALSDAALLER